MKLFVILGNDCNLQCTYCCQRQIKERQIPRAIKPRFWEYFHSIPPKTPVVFFGGEPLLYFGAIKEIMSHRSDLCYGIITNGKLLDKDKVEWLNKYDVGVTVSWDGPISKKTRGYDVLQENPNIKDVDNLCISAVLTKWTVVHDVINRVSELLPDKEFSLNFDFPLNFTSSQLEFEEVDVDQLYKDMCTCTERFINGTATVPEASMIFSTLYQLTGQYDYGNKCGNGTTVINIDLDGSLYNCHDESKPSEYSCEWDKTIKRQQGMCAKCDMLRFCGGGCSLMSDEATLRRCPIVRAYYGGVIDTLYKNYGGEQCSDITVTMQHR